MYLFGSTAIIVHGILLMVTNTAAIGVFDKTSLPAFRSDSDYNMVNSKEPNIRASWILNYFELI